jgi:hypothetical protein
LAAEVPQALRADQAVWSVLDQRQGRVVLEIFRPGDVLPDPPVILPLAALPDPEGRILLVGDAADPVAAALTARGFQASAEAPAQPSAWAVGRVAHQRLIGALPQRGAAPLYAEPPATTRPA